MTCDRWLFLRAGQAIKVATDTLPGWPASFVVGVIVEIDDSLLRFAVVAEVCDGRRVFKRVGRILSEPAPGRLPYDRPGRISVVDPAAVLAAISKIGGDSLGV